MRRVIGRADQQVSDLVRDGAAEQRGAFDLRRAGERDDPVEVYGRERAGLDGASSPWDRSSP